MQYNWVLRAEQIYIQVIMNVSNITSVFLDLISEWFLIPVSKNTYTWIFVSDSREVDII